jgi:hypothetical protein
MTTNGESEAGLAAVELSVGVLALLHLPGQPSVWAAMAANTASRAGDAGGVGGDHTRSRGQLFRAQRGPDLPSRRDVPLSSGTPQQGFDAALGEPPAQVGGRLGATVSTASAWPPARSVRPEAAG